MLSLNFIQTSNHLNDDKLRDNDENNIRVTKVIKDICFGIAVGYTEADAILNAERLVKDFDKEWDDFSSGWNKRWVDAFTPGNAHFSGSLPILSFPNYNESPSSRSIHRIYYMSIYSILACERVNLPKLSPRVYITASGNANPSVDDPIHPDQKNTGFFILWNYRRIT